MALHKFQSWKLTLRHEFTIDRVLKDSREPSSNFRSVTFWALLKWTFHNCGSVCSIEIAWTEQWSHIGGFLSTRGSESTCLSEHDIALFRFVLLVCCLYIAQNNWNIERFTFTCNTQEGDRMIITDDYRNRIQPRSIDLTSSYNRTPM